VTLRESAIRRFLVNAVNALIPADLSENRAISRSRYTGFEPRRLRKIPLFRSLLISFGLILAPSCRAVVLAKEETLVNADPPNQMPAVGHSANTELEKAGRSAAPVLYRLRGFAIT
jgi:hypothetical protein